MIEMLNDVYEYDSYVDKSSMTPVKYGIILSFQNANNSDRYNSGSLNNKKFLMVERKMFDILKNICKYEHIKFAYVEFYQKTYNKLSNKLYRKMNNGKTVYTNELRVIESIFTDAIKGRIFALFLLGNRYVVVPTDHLDVFLAGDFDDVDELRERLLREYDELNIVKWNKIN